MADQTDDHNECASCFTEKAVMPTRESLESVISASLPLLRDIENRVTELCGPFQCAWKFYGKRAGWTAAFEHAGRRLFHLIPQAGRFTIVFVLGKRAVTACVESQLPDTLKSALLTAPEYVEGRLIRIDVRCAADVSPVKELIAIKLAN